MNNLKEILQKSDDIGDFAKKYFSYLHEILTEIDPKLLNALEKEIDVARENGNTIFVAGNGGSAATASHIGNDIGMAAQKVNNKKPYKVFALTDNIALITAIANDYGYSEIFTEQLKIHFKKGDKLIVISASGNSENLVSAANWTKSNGGSVIGLLGFEGGKLKDIVDLSIIAKTPKGEYGPVEDVHMILDHLITSWLHYKLK